MITQAREFTLMMTRGGYCNDYGGQGVDSNDDEGVLS